MLDMHAFRGRTCNSFHADRQQKNAENRCWGCVCGIIYCAIQPGVCARNSWRYACGPDPVWVTNVWCHRAALPQSKAASLVYSEKPKHKNAFNTRYCLHAPTCVVVLPVESIL